MAISDLIQGLQGLAWPEFLQPHVEVLLLWITWAVDYIDLEYLDALFIYYHGCLPLDVYYLISKLVLHKKRSLHCVGDKFIFKIPGWRPLCKMFSITAGTVDECTTELNEGNLLCIAPGGVREALFSDPNVYDILWGKRLGFAKVVIASKTPVIPMFTENCRESFRTPEWGRSFFRWIYEKTKVPLCPIYGGFPVKMITHLGPPITFDYDNVTPEEVRKVIKKEIRNLIREHQRLPGSIIRAILQRFEKKDKEGSGTQRTTRINSGQAHEQVELLPINGRSTTERESSEIEIGRSPNNSELRTLSPEEEAYNAAMDDERDELGGI
ncbi:hypothetical protein WR25_01060 [Diploscapter pachys]|uniref:Phospholipid/glycerol acyltransferase domain-containing protein n=1 Tax=Diploscapter pachys TaxID=2018661 RepID=A0A2A2JSV2_9BILA|nr:hypothetical protein WR25_01060 [Diploscapter pachys]